MTVKSLYIFLTLAACMSGSVIANTFPGDSNSQISYQDLYKNVETLIDLQTLMKIVDREHNLSRLEIHHTKDAQWVFEEGNIIRRIDIDSEIKPPRRTRSALNRFIGRIESDYVRNSIIDGVFDAYYIIGYPEIEISQQHETSNKFTSISLKVFPGRRCRIAKIDFPFASIPGIDFGIKLGDPCSFLDIDDAMSDFEDDLASNGFQNSSFALKSFAYSRDKRFLQLTFEGSLGTRIDYKVIDESSFIFDGVIGDVETNYMRQNLANPVQAKEFILQHMHEAGYPFASVKGPVPSKIVGGTLYTFTVFPGNRFQIGSVIFLGNRFFSDEELARQISKIDIVDIFNTEGGSIYNKAVMTIRDLYIERGFWNIEVARSRLDFDRDTLQSTLYIDIREGPQYLLDRVEISGNYAFSTDEIRSLLKIEDNGALEQEKISDFEHDLRGRYFEAGYIFSSFEIKTKDEFKGDQVFRKLYVTIEEGKVAVIGAISLHGLVFTQREIIDREIKFASGERFSQKKIDDTRNAILSLGFFSSVLIEWKNQTRLGRKNTVDIFVRLAEAQPGRISFGPGFDLRRGFKFASEFSYSNLFGTGRRFAARASISEERHQKSIVNPKDSAGSTLVGRKVSVNYLEPYILGESVHGAAAFHHKAIADDIWKISNSAELSLKYHFDPDIFFGMINPFYRINILDNEGSIQQEDSLIATGSTRVAGIGMRYRLDLRNNLAWPTSGFLLNTEAEWARYEFFSEFRFFKWHVSYSQYLPLADNLALALGIRVTAYERVRRRNVDEENVDVLPANNRLLAGGSNEVRGFREQLGPYVLIKNTLPNGDVIFEREDPLGGSNRFIFKSELRRQLIHDVLGTSVFYELGNSFFSNDESDKFQQRFEEKNTRESLRSVEDNFPYTVQDVISDPQLLLRNNFHSFGVALNLLTPLGALNLAVAWPLSEPEGDTCRDIDVCFSRASDANNYLNSYEIELNIGAEF